MTFNRRKKSRFCILPGRNGPYPPIHDVDAVFRAHDICYQMGKHHCACDREFIDRLSST